MEVSQNLGYLCKGFKVIYWNVGFWVKGLRVYTLQSEKLSLLGLSGTVHPTPRSPPVLGRLSRAVEALKQFLIHSYIPLCICRHVYIHMGGCIRCRIIKGIQKGP